MNTTLRQVSHAYECESRNEFFPEPWSLLSVYFGSLGTHCLIGGIQTWNSRSSNPTHGVLGHTWTCQVTDIHSLLYKLFQVKISRPTSWSIRTASRRKTKRDVLKTGILSFYWCKCFVVFHCVEFVQWTNCNRCTKTEPIFCPLPVKMILAIDEGQELNYMVVCARVVGSNPLTVCTCALREL